MWIFTGPEARRRYPSRSSLQKEREALLRRFENYSAKGFPTEGSISAGLSRELPLFHKNLWCTYPSL